jgi:hypothetical protein
MNVLDYNKPVEEQEQDDGVLRRLGGLFKDSTPSAEEIIIPLLDRALDNKFTLLSNYPLPGLEVTIPMILVGPPGVRVILPFDQIGVYRVRGEEWLELNTRKRSFQQGKENLVARTKMFATAIHKYFNEHNLSLPEVEPIMIFANAGTHVDYTRPIVRIVLRDAIEKYAVSLNVAQVILNQNEIHKIIRLITRPPKPEIKEKVSEFEGMDEVEGDDAVPSWLPASVFKRFSFTRTQWIIVGVLFSFWILIMMVLFCVVISTM